MTDFSGGVHNFILEHPDGLQAKLTHSLVLDRGTGDPTFTRATTSTVEDFEGLIKTVKSGEARFKGARRVENLQAYSQDFANAGSQSHISIGVGSVAPDGSNMDTLIESADTNIHRQVINNTVVEATVYTISVYAKASGRNYLFINSASLIGADSTFDLANGTITDTDTGSATIEDCGSGIYRCSVTGTASSSQTTSYYLQINSTVTNASDDNYAGNGTSGIDVWGIQFETGSHVSEYVNTNVLSAPYHGCNVDGVQYFNTELTGSPIAEATLKGVVVENAATNLCLYSEDFSNAYWSNSRITILDNNKIISDGGGYSRIYHAGYPVTNATTYTLTFYVEEVSASQQFCLRIQNPGDTVYNFTPVATERFSMTFTTTSTTGLNFFIYLNPDGDSGTAQIGDYIKGYFQLEVGVHATTYIPTVSSAVTRNADVLSYPSAGNIDSTVGAMSCEFTTDWTDAVNISPYLLAGSSGRINFDNDRKLIVYDGSGPRGEQTVLGATTLQKIGANWGDSLMNTFYGGASGTEGSFDNDMGFGATLYFGIRGSGSDRALNGTLKNIKIWKRKLPANLLVGETG